MTWTAKTEALDPRTDRIVLGGATHGDVVELWRTNEGFANSWTDLLAGSRFTTYFWELPPLTNATLQRTFECVLLDARGFPPADESAFSTHFNADEVVTFPNLGGDATLVVPCPRGPSTAYGHLAAFARTAPSSQAIALWRAVGTAISSRISDQPLWVSTAGLGVAWLHVRVDTRPKYYRYEPYKTPPR